MAMWPDAARTKEIRAQAEREASRRAESKTEEPKDPEPDSKKPSPEAAKVPDQDAPKVPDQDAPTETREEPVTSPRTGTHQKENDIPERKEKPSSHVSASSNTATRQANPPKKAQDEDPRSAPEQSKQKAGEKPAKSKQAKHIKPDAKQKPQHRSGKSPNRKMIAIGSAMVAALVVLVVVLVNIIPITVTVNGQQVQIAGSKTIGAAIEKAGINVTPGNFLAVDGSIITEGGGQPFDATIGDVKTSDPQQKLTDGAVIDVANGSDIIEDFTLSTEEAPFSATIDGTGAIHTLSGTGQNGEQEVKTGSVSGLQAITITTDPVNVVCTYLNANVGSQKVVALTFDDGPNADYTPQILDVLEKNGASATFFTLGSRIEGSCVEIVQRAYNAGHQICTHSWDHAAGSGMGVNLAHMTKEEQIDEILKGYEAIEAAIGVEASKIIRTPGGNFPPDVIANLSPYITSEIGWNIDTQDWTKPGVAAIKAQILAATPGDIILMHDGGGDRSQTVQALSEALPVLKARGFQFVTIDRLLEISAENS